MAFAAQDTNLRCKWRERKQTKNELFPSSGTVKEAEKMPTGSAVYLWKQQGANNAQSGLEVVFEPEPDGMDAASHVDNVEQLQALEEEWREA